VTAADLDRDGQPGDVLVRQADGRMRAYYADATGRLSRANTFGHGWGGLDELTTGTDWDGDGIADLIGRVMSTGDLRLYAGTGQRDFSRVPITLDTGLTDANLVRPVGDVDGDGLSDAVARTSAGDLIGLRGRGAATSTGYPRESAPAGRSSTSSSRSVTTPTTVFQTWSPGRPAGHCGSTR
jgi:hypothetical protein